MVSRHTGHSRMLVTSADLTTASTASPPPRPASSALAATEDTVSSCPVCWENCTVLYRTELYCTDLLGELLDAVAHLQLVALLGQLARSLPLVVLQSAQVMLLSY